MKPIDIINDLLEGYPGASQKELDEIMAIVYNIADDIVRKEVDYRWAHNKDTYSKKPDIAAGTEWSLFKSLNLETDKETAPRQNPVLCQYLYDFKQTESNNVGEFIDRVNSSIIPKKFHVWFCGSWSDLFHLWSKKGTVTISPQGLNVIANLKKHVARGFHSAGWCYVIGPNKVSRWRIDQIGIRGLIAHELVHQSQARKMPPDKYGEIITKRQKHRKWRENPGLVLFTRKHETPAYAAGLVNDFQNSGLTKAEILQTLRNGRFSFGGRTSQCANYSMNTAFKLRKNDPKAYKRFLKQAVGYAEQLPENMKPEYIVDTLLESLPGMSQAELDEIMNIIRSVVDRVKSGNPQVDIPRFEQEVNPLLEPYRVKFVSNDPVLMKYHMPARAGFDGAIVQTPSRISRDGFNNVPMMLSHELVHVDQMSRAFHGNAMKMYQSSHDRMLPGGKFDHQAYQTDPHEVTAYARSLIDQMRSRKGTKDQALTALKSGSGNRLKHVDTKSHHRFLKAAAGYAQDLPSK